MAAMGQPRCSLLGTPCLLALCAAVASCTPLPKIQLRSRPSGERVFVDSYGRERAFHGTNAIVKGPPWIPSREGFDPITSLTAEDFKLMQSVGLNVIRLGVMWAGVEPTRGHYNTTYLRIVREIAEEAATYGIYILADMHQDVFSEKFCGEGMPLWASQTERIMPFPMPLAMPFKRGKDGLPTKKECSKKPWSSYQGAIAAGVAYERLYTNHAGLTDAWGAFWAKVVETFQSAPELLGLNLINEPFIGNPYADPALLVPDIGDRLRLQPAYDRISTHIRAVAPDALLFFAGCTWDRTGKRITDILPLGFEHAPGGSEYADRAVHSFHFYSPPQSKNKTKDYFAQRLKDARRLGTGLMLSESCCDGLFRLAAPVAESMGVSWIQWEWKDFCKETNETLASESQHGAFGACKNGYGAGPFDATGVNEVKLKEFARPYAPAIAGNFTTASFDATSSSFKLTFAVNPSIKAPTVISAPKLMYPNGFAVTVTPTGALEVVTTEMGLELHASEASSFGQEVSVEVTPMPMITV